MCGGRKEIKGTGCENSDEMDQFSALAQRRINLPQTMVCTDKLSGPQQSTEANSATSYKQSTHSRYIE